MQLQKTDQCHHDASDASETCDEDAGSLHLRDIFVKNETTGIHTCNVLRTHLWRKLVYAVAKQIMIYI